MKTYTQADYVAFITSLAREQYSLLALQGDRAVNMFSKCFGILAKNGYITYEQLEKFNDKVGLERQATLNNAPPLKSMAVPTHQKVIDTLNWLADATQNLEEMDSGLIWPAVEYIYDFWDVAGWKKTAKESR